eukprot:COSAG02_NODE_101_length_36804_cov_125.342951_4_plen_288_part_00
MEITFVRVVGLIMGTRIWYKMWDAEKDDNAAFNVRLDAVLREIGERGRLMVADAVPPVAQLKLEAPKIQAPAATPVLVRAATDATLGPASEAAQSLAPAPTSIAATTSPRTHSAPAPVAAALGTPAIPTTTTPGANSSTLSQERDELLRQMQQISAQLASIDMSASAPIQQPVVTQAHRWTHDQDYIHNGSPSSSQLLFLERERERRSSQVERERADRLERTEQRAERAEQRAERERSERERSERQRERAERSSETRLIAAFASGSCACGLGAAIGGVGVAWSLKKT